MAFWCGVIAIFTLAAILALEKLFRAPLKNWSMEYIPKAQQGVGEGLQHFVMLWSYGALAVVYFTPALSTYIMPR